MSPTEKQPELKPCPFCGGEPELIIGLMEVTDGEIHCECGGSVGNFPTGADAIEAWNARSLTAAEAQEVKPVGLSPWQGWDQGREGWAEVKHKDAVCAVVFGPTWSMEDAHELISFIDRTWGAGNS